MSDPTRRLLGDARRCAFLCSVSAAPGAPGVPAYLYMGSAPVGQPAPGAASAAGGWAAEAAGQAGAAFVDLNELVAREYEAVGPEVVAARFFGTDHTHTTEAGAALTAGVVAGAIRGVLDAERKDDAPPPGPRP